MSDRVDQMKSMRAGGMTLREIGHHFGVSRERIRQQIGNTGYTPKSSKWPRAYFSRVIKKWLWDVGYRRCPCGMWEAGITAINRRCRECSRKRAKAYYATPQGKAKHREWHQNNRDRDRATLKRWREKERARRSEG